MSVIAKRRTVARAGSAWQPTEEQEQAAVFEWAVLMRNQFPELSLLFHIPNGGWRAPATAAKLKAQGVKAGVPDLFLPVARGGFHGLWIELKRQHDGKLSKPQKEWIDDMRKQGYKAERANGADEAIAILQEYLGL